MAVKEPAIDLDGLYQLAFQAQCIDQLEDELYQLKRLVKANYEFKDFLEDNFVPLSTKKKFLAEIMPAGTSTLFQELVNHLLEIGRADWFHRLSDLFSQTVAQKTGRVLLEVYSPFPLSGDFLRQIQERLKPAMRSGLIIKNVVNPDLIAGLMFKIGDLIIDASLRQKLNLLKKALA